MKVLVCGDRHWKVGSIVKDKILALIPEDSGLLLELTVIHGDARGADRWADYVCKKYGINVVAFPADWEQYGRAAGPIRNRLMLDQKPDLVMAFHDNILQSKGTQDTVMEALRRRITVKLYNSKGEEVTEELYGRRYNPKD